MHPLYYYFGAPDSDSADDTYDPTRECFNIDGAIASDSEDCHMLRRYFESIGIKKDDKKEDPKGDDKDEGFPEIHDCFMIYGGPSMCLSTRQHKWERREVFSVQLATPLFLEWSEVAFTFDRDDHPGYVPNPRVYPLVVDPIITNTCLTKVLMDGGSSLNIIYS
jgi:hypothetical protein